jgi:hypothetical protein
VIDDYGRNACACGYVPPTYTHEADCPAEPHRMYRVIVNAIQDWAIREAADWPRTRCDTITQLNHLYADADRIAATVCGGEK